MKSVPLEILNDFSFYQESKTRIQIQLTSKGTESFRLYEIVFPTLIFLFVRLFFLHLPNYFLLFLWRASVVILQCFQMYRVYCRYHLLPHEAKSCINQEMKLTFWSFFFLCSFREIIRGHRQIPHKKGKKSLTA